MGARIRNFKPDEQFVLKNCENSDCQKTFYVASRYAGRTLYCSNSCLQHVFYLSRKLRESDSAENETQNIEDANNLTPTDMELTERLLEKTDQLNDLKIKYALLEKDFQSFEKEKEHLESKIEILKESHTKLAEANEKLQKDVETQMVDNSVLIVENQSLTENWQGLIIAHLILISRGAQNYEGRTIKFADITSNITDFKYKKNAAFELSVMDWQLVHRKDSDVLEIHNNKKS
jgi:hypothetical protein